MKTVTTLTVQLSRDQQTLLRLAVRDAIYYYRRTASMGFSDEFSAHMNKEADELEVILQALYDAPETLSAPFFTEDFSNEGCCVDGGSIWDSEHVPF